MWYMKYTYIYIFIIRFPHRVPRNHWKHLVFAAAKLTWFIYIFATARDCTLYKWSIPALWLQYAALKTLLACKTTHESWRLKGWFSRIKVTTVPRSAENLSIYTFWYLCKYTYISFFGRFKSKTWHVHMKTYEDQLTTQLASIDHTTLHHPYLLVDLLFLAVAPNALMIFALMKVYTCLIFKQPSWSSWFIPFTTSD